MASSQVTWGKQLLERLAHTYPFLLLATLPAGVALSFLLDSPELASSGLLLLGPPVVLSFALLYALQRRSTDLRAMAVQTNPGTWQALFVAALGASIAALALTSYRPWYYFPLVATLYLLVLVQIAADASPRAVVAQIVAIMLAWSYGVTLNYALYFGGTSVLPHRFYAELTYASGSVIPADLSSYAFFPLYHTFLAGAAHLLGIGVGEVMALVTPVPYVVTAALVYKLFAGVTGDDRLGLLTALLYSALPTVVYYGPYVITRTMAFVGFVALLYVAYSRNRFTRGQYALLVGLLVAFIGLVHHVSTPQILSLLFVLGACEYALSDRRFVRAPAAALAGFAGIYWTTLAIPFVRNLIATFGASSNYDEAQVVESAGETAHHVGFYLNNYAVVFLLTVGIGVVLWRRRNHYAAVFGTFMLVTLALFIPSPIHALSQTLHLFRMDRYALLLSPVAAFTMAVGVYGLYSGLSSTSRRRTVRTAVVVALVAMLALSSVTASSAASNASDAKDLDWTGPPSHFTEEEMRALEFTTANVPEGSNVAGDWHTARYFRPMAYEFEGADRYDVPIYDRSIIYTVDDVRDHQGYVVVRSERLASGEILLGGDGKGQRAAFGDRGEFYAALEGDDKVYANAETELYRSPPSDGDGDESEA